MMQGMAMNFVFLTLIVVCVSFLGAQKSIIGLSEFRRMVSYSLHVPSLF